tara:strand:+ start:221 stop:661 length:441 start_codon:yes stop_codon:yes gene_type:complete
MRFSVDDIRNQRFKTKFNGLDKNDVMTYLQLVADDFEAFRKEAEEFKDELKKKDKTIKKYKDREEKMKSLFETLCKEKGISLNELYNEKSVNKNPAEMGEKIVKKALNRAKEIKKITEKGVHNIQKEILFLEKHKKSLIENIKSKA